MSHREESVEIPVDEEFIAGTLLTPDPPAAAAPGVLFLHGWGATGDLWAPVLGDLQAGRQLIVPDVPGFGETPPPPTAWAVDDYVRWTLAPVQPYEAGSRASQDKNFLFDGLIASIQQHPLQWHLVMTVAQPGDATDNATIQWPEGREQVDVGTLTLDSVESEETSPARDINFDPLVLPVGMAPSKDPLLSARSAVYSQSFTRRAGEMKEPSEITPSEVRK